MQLTISMETNMIVVTPGGPRLDAPNTLEFKEQMRGIVNDTRGPILLDMRMVDFLDSSGLGAIVSISRIMGEERALELRNLSPVVTQVFELTKMNKVFTVRDAEAA